VLSELRAEPKIDIKTPERTPEYQRNDIV